MLNKKIFAIQLFCSLLLAAFHNRLFLQKFEKSPENLMKFVSFENTFILTAILRSLKHAKLNAAVTWYTPRFLTYHFLLCIIRYMRQKLDLSRKMRCEFFCLILFLQNAKTVSSPNSKKTFYEIKLCKVKQNG